MTNLIIIGVTGVRFQMYIHCFIGKNGKRYKWSRRYF